MFDAEKLFLNMLSDSDNSISASTVVSYDASGHPHVKYEFSIVPKHSYLFDDYDEDDDEDAVSSQWTESEINDLIAKTREQSDKEWTESIHAVTDQVKDELEKEAAASAEEMIREELSKKRCCGKKSCEKSAPKAEQLPPGFDIFDSMMKGMGYSCVGVKASEAPAVEKKMASSIDEYSMSQLCSIARWFFDEADKKEFGVDSFDKLTPADKIRHISRILPDIAASDGMIAF